MKTKPMHPLRPGQSGSAILAALGILVLTSMIVGTTLLESQNRFHTSSQSSKWSQAAHAAEAGAELALMSAQNNSWTTNGWTAAPGAPGTAAVTKTFDLAAGVPSSGPVSADVSVDQITLSGKQWLRIRSTGRADLPGGAVAGLDPQDVLLRKVSLRTDRTTGTSVATPRATRTVEVLAEPLSKSIFVRPLLMQQKLTMSGGWVDSFDSDDPTKSTGGLYDVTKATSNGEIAIMDTQNSSDLGGVPVKGNVKYGVGTAPANTGGVTGTITTPFTETIQPVTDPTWTTFNATPTQIKTTMSLTAGTQAAPALFKVSELTIGGGKVLTIDPVASGVESYIEIWVTGKMTVSGSGYIVLKPGVHATFHVDSDITVSGSAINNQSNRAANAIINGAGSTSQKVTVSGSGTFIGIINAPNAAFTASGSASMSGAFIGRTMNISGGANVHYDEALSRMGGSGTSGFRVASFVEMVR